MHLVQVTAIFYASILLLFAFYLFLLVTQTKAGEVTPDFKLLSDLLYENPLGSQMWLLYDSNKQEILCGDAYPRRVCTD